jgi:sortase A
MWSFKKPMSSPANPPGGAGQVARRGRNTWIWAERLLITSGTALLLFYGIARIDSFLASRAELKRFASMESMDAARANDIRDPGATPAGTSPESAVEMETPRVDFRLWDQRRVRAYRDKRAAMSVAPLGVLRIPTINLEAPLLDGTDDVTLNHGVGRIAGTARPGEQGNIGIAGHRDGFFRGLKDVTTGDAIEIKTLKGTDTYIVDGIQIVTPDNIDVLRPRSIPSVTLVTCYPFHFFGSAPKRYLVTASLSREIKSGAENSTPSPQSAGSSSIRRNHEQSE